MDIVQLTEILGNVGEFIGSLAVLATLIYLSIQVNHSRGVLDKQSEAIAQSIQIAKATAQTDLLSRNIEWFKSIVENEDVAQLNVKLIKAAELTEVERARASALYQQLHQLWASALYYHRDGLIDDETLDRMVVTAPRSVAQSMPGLLPMMRRMSERDVESSELNPLLQTIRQILTEYEENPE